MIKNFTKTDKQFGIALLIGLAIRLIAIPFSRPDQADAVTRIFIAQTWMANPEFISSGVWGPLHTYLIAAILYVWDDAVYAPVFQNCLFSAAVAIPLYFFVKREWDEIAALFVACLYLAYPVAIHYGLVAMTEIPYIFFIALALLALSHARSENGNWKHALSAGLIITMASALRYEAWGLIPFLGLLLWKKWKELLIFFAASSIFPVFWLIGSYLEYGDPFYSFTWSVDWNLNVSLGNEGLTAVDIINRLIYFPRALFFGLTPLAFLACAAGIILVLYHRKKQWVWLIPFVALFLTYTLNAVNGKLTTQIRYSLNLAIFIIPFAAEWFLRQKDARRFLFSAIVVGSMLPLSYLHYIIPWPFDFPHPVPKQISFLPQVEQSTVRISEYQIQQSEQYAGGLLLDFYDWSETYYIALMSRKNAANIFIMPGEVNEPLDMNELNAFMKNNPTGIIVLTQKPRFMQIEPTANGDQLSITGYEKTLSVEDAGESEGWRFYRYTVDP